MLQKTMQRVCYGYADVLRNPVCRGVHFEMLVKSSTGPETSWPTDLNLHVCASHRLSATSNFWFGNRDFCFTIHFLPTIGRYWKSATCLLHC